MAFILTFLGKGGSGRTTLAIAAAKQQAADGRRTLLVAANPAPDFELLLGQTLGNEPTELETNLAAVRLDTTQLLEASWDEIKKLEAQYVRTPFFKEIYGQELAVLPAMDSAFALNALRDYDLEDKYDTIVYDGPSDLETLRVFGIAEIGGWYLRRFRSVWDNSDFAKTVMPFLQPISSAVLNTDFSKTSFSPNKMDELLDEGRAMLGSPSRVAAYLVTTPKAADRALAAYRWGQAQIIGLTVGGVLLNQCDDASVVGDEFESLHVATVPTMSGDNWQAAIEALPDFANLAQHAPRPMTIDVASKTVTLFLPGFTKKQVKLIQSGPEVTIEAGGQRRNILLPSALQGRSVTGAKFNDRYLTISF
ncbi:MAG: ArsA family ATPase [Coleofasciculaceae cyanobacterium RL_1_1]|nr:ArsA family ATPase [Coleofasciculaceae cyanobacterium RL_1_1]